MKVVAVVSQKGGVGKTTVATELAVAAVTAGYNTLVFDLDPQGSAGTWSDTRNGPAPQVVAVPAPRLKAFLEQARAAGADLVVMDTAPHASQIVVDAAKASDLCLVPCTPSPRDTSAIGTTLSAVTDLAGKRGYVVINEADQRSVMYRLMRQALTDAGVPICPAILGDRRTFAAAVGVGQTSTEYEPSGKAAAEANALWAWASRELGIPASRESGNAVKRKSVKA